MCFSSNVVKHYEVTIHCRGNGSSEEGGATSVGGAAVCTSVVDEDLTNCTDVW